MLSPEPPAPPPRHARGVEERVIMAGSGEELSVEKVKAALRKQRADSGQIAVPAPVSPTPIIAPVARQPLPPASVVEDANTESVRAMLRQTRACAIKNGQSADMLRDTQSTTPGRGFQTTRFKTRNQVSEPTKRSDDAKEKSP